MYETCHIICYISQLQKNHCVWKELRELDNEIGRRCQENKSLNKFRTNTTKYFNQVVAAIQQVEIHWNH